jgi:soluble lytic murein transglycosylase-like protein
VTPEQLHRPETNISVAFKHFHHLLTKYRGNLALALYAWNRGSGRVDKLLLYGESPQNSYVQKVYEAALVNNRDLLIERSQ